MSVNGLLTPAEIDELDRHSMAMASHQIDLAATEASSRLGADRKLEDANDMEDAFFRFIQFHRHLPLHEHYMLHPRILDCVEDLVGADVMAMQSMLFLKPPVCKHVTESLSL